MPRDDASPERDQQLVDAEPPTGLIIESVGGPVEPGGLIAPPPPLVADSSQAVDERPVAHDVDDAFELTSRPDRPRADPLATAAVICAIVQLSVVAIVLGHLALSRIARSRAGGRTRAQVAVIAGYAELAVTIALVAVYFAVLAPIVALP